MSDNNDDWVKLKTRGDWSFSILLMIVMIFGMLAIFAWMSWFSPAHARDLAVGDSIALGTGHALHVPTRAKVGAGSCAIADRMPRGAYDRVVISAGINDQGLCVQAVRAAVHARRVTWILPAPINGGRAMVLAVMRLGDRSVSYACAGGCSRSNFHPASYAVLARAVRASWK